MKLRFKIFFNSAKVMSQYLRTTYLVGFGGISQEGGGVGGAEVYSSDREGEVERGGADEHPSKTCLDSYTHLMSIYLRSPGAFRHLEIRRFGVVFSI